MSYSRSLYTNVSSGGEGPTGPTGNIDITGIVSGTGNVLLKGSDGLYYSNIVSIGNNEIDISGNIVPTQSNTYSLGTTGLRWREVFMGPGSLNIP